MRQVPLGDGGLGLSRLGFGCAPVMGRVGRRQALDAMACAFDAGVTHFDVARSYGFGDAERVVGEFLRGRRDRVTVATKFGIVPPELAAWKKAARPVLRPLLKLAAPLRRQVRRSSAELLAERRFDLAYARSCLATSLRELGTERIDLYLLHEPDLDTLAGVPELRGFLDDSVAAGRLRAWGFAHPHRAAPRVSGDAAARGRVLQVEAPASRAEPWPLDADEARLVVVTRPLGGGALATGTGAGTAVDLDPLVAAMARALAAAGDGGTTVAGMFDRAHIRRNVTAVEAYEHDRAAIDAALAAAGVGRRDRPSTSAPQRIDQRPA